MTDHEKQIEAHLQIEKGLLEEMNRLIENDTQYKHQLRIDIGNLSSKLTTSMCLNWVLFCILFVLILYFNEP